MKLKEIIEGLDEIDGFCQITPGTLELMMKRFAADNVLGGLDLRDLTLRYFGAVDRIASDIDTKTHFNAEEICSIIFNLIKENAEQPENTYSIMFAGTHYDDAYLDCEQIEGVFDEFNDAVKTQQIVGEIEPPVQNIVSLSKVSHMVEETWFDKGVVYARIRILETPNGETLKTLLAAGKIIFRPTLDYKKVKLSINGTGADFIELKEIVTIHAIRKELDPFKL